MRDQEFDNELTQLSVLTPPGLLQTQDGDLLWLIPMPVGMTAISLNSFNYRPMQYSEVGIDGGAWGKWLGPLELRLGYEALGDFDGVIGLVRRDGSEFYLTALDDVGNTDEFRLVEYERKFLSHLGKSRAAQIFSHWSLVKWDQHGGETVFISAVEPVRFPGRHFPQCDSKPLGYQISEK